MGNTTKSSKAKQTSGTAKELRSGSFWLKLSVVFGLLPSVYFFFEDLVGTIGSSSWLFSALLATIGYLSPIAAVVFCSVGVVKVGGWKKSIPIILLLLNLTLFFFVYALYMWSKS